MTKPNLTIDSEFAELCPSLAPEETKLLADALIRDGCRDPIRFWSNPDNDGSPIIDGHNRYGLIVNGIPVEWAMDVWHVTEQDVEAMNRKLKKVKFAVEGVELANRTAARNWIIVNQLGRRNVSEAQKALLRAELLELKTEQAQQDADEFWESLSPEGGFCDSLSQKLPSRGEVLEKVAKETGVSSRQVRRDEKFKAALDKLADKAPGLRDRALRGEVSREAAMALADASRQALVALERVPGDKIRKAANEAAERASQKAALPPVEVNRPVMSIQALVELEKAAGAVVRANGAAVKDCGGKNGWGWRHHEAVRENLARVFDAIVAWQKEAEEREKPSR